VISPRSPQFNRVNDWQAPRKKSEINPSALVVWVRRKSRRMVKGSPLFMTSWTMACRDFATASLINYDSSQTPA
jgi:hypothetical protein